MKVKIVSNGTAKTTHVYTDSGEDISHNIRKLDINIQAGGLVVVVAEFFNVDIDSDAYLVAHPVKGLLSLFRHWVKRLGE
jgi:hypothetical protein